MLTKIKKLLADAIKGTEFEGKTWFAGGCVRDELIGRKTQDIDITVELQEGGIRLAKHLHAVGLATKPVVYKQFGTALVKIRDYKIELVMTRKENYRYRNRKPDVQFGSLREDVMRRDFTVNSLLLNVSDGRLLDLCGRGKADLEAKIIRATSDPEIIFREDPLRMLRAIRIATYLQFEIEKKTWLDIKKFACEIGHISRERIAEETLKIIACPNFLTGLALLVKSGLKSAAFPGLKFPRVLLELHLFEPGLRPTLFIKPSVERLSIASRLVLLLWWHVDTGKYLRMLKLPAREIRHVAKLRSICKITRRYDEVGVLNKQEEYRLIAWQSQDFIDEFLMLYPFTGIFWGYGEKTWYADLQNCQNIRHALKQIEKNRFSLTGDDLIRTFCIKSSPKIGKILDAAFNYWLRNPHADKQEMLDFLAGKPEKE